MLSLTEPAVKRVKEIISKEKSGSFLRVSVLGGGCAGFQYNFDIDTKFSDKEDKVVLKEGNNMPIIVVDEMSSSFLQECTLDYIEEIGASFFKIVNPNAASTCGCGNSFSV